MMRKRASAMAFTGVLVDYGEEERLRAGVHGGDTATA